MIRMLFIAISYLIFLNSAYAKTWENFSADKSEIKVINDLSNWGAKYNLNVIFDNAPSGFRTLSFRINSFTPKKKCDLGSKLGKGLPTSFKINGKSQKGIIACSEKIGEKGKLIQIFPTEKRHIDAIAGEFKRSNEVRFEVNKLSFVIPADGFTKAWRKFTE